MGSHKKKGCYFPEQVPPPPLPDYVVTGNPSPDCTGEYFYQGQHNGQPYYKRSDVAFYIYWHTIGGAFWSIDTELEALPPNWFHLVTITGVYTPQPPYTGNPVVSEA